MVHGPLNIAASTETLLAANERSGWFCRTIAVEVMVTCPYLHVEGLCKGLYTTRTTPGIPTIEFEAGVLTTQERHVENYKTFNYIIRRIYNISCVIP
jgi:hypothetical protein